MVYLIGGLLTVLGFVRSVARRFKMDIKELFETIDREIEAIKEETNGTGKQ